MATIIEAIYENGVLRPLATEGLKERHHYRLSIEEITVPEPPLPANDRERAHTVSGSIGLRSEVGHADQAVRDAGWAAFDQLIEEYAIDTGISDLAHQHDHYFHGTPKKA